MICETAFGWGDCGIMCNETDVGRLLTGMVLLCLGACGGDCWGNGAWNVCSVVAYCVLMLPL